MALSNTTPRERGQAAIEYVGLIAVVAMILAALAILVPRPAQDMLGVVEQAICSGLGRECEIGGEESLALAPCPVHRSVTSADVHATVLSVRAGRGESALIEELSDGSATVTLADRSEFGLEGGVGASLAGGGGTVGVRAEGSTGLAFGAGRGYRFAGVDEAMRFLAEHRGSTGSGGAVEAIAGPVCVLCSIARVGGDRPPEPDVSYLEGGGAVRASAEAGAGPAGAGAEASGIGALGRMVDHQTGEVTTYYRVGGEAGGDLGGPVAWAGEAGADGVLEHTTAADGTPLSLTARSTRAWSGGTGPALRAPGAGAIGRRGAVSAAERGGHVMEEVAILDLRDRANRRAAARLVAALRPPSDPVALSAGLRAVDRRMDRDAAIGERLFRATDRETELSADAALGMKLGAGVTDTSSELTLTGARTRPAGATLYLRRADCLD